MIDTIEVGPVVPLPSEPSYTGIEQRLYRLLASVHLDFAPQVSFGMYTVDAYVPRYHIAIEADGCFWHGCAVCGAYLPEIIEQEQRRHIRDERLYRRHGLSVLHLWGHNLQADDDALNALLAVLTPWLQDAR